MVALPANFSVTEAIRELVASTHVRAPVFRGDLDEIIGVAHLVDLAEARGRVADHCRPALALPESLGVLEALRRMQRERQQLAIVINEYGGTEGIVTVEDLLEELVGEVYDEFDRDISTVERDPDGALVLPGSFPVHDLQDLGVWSCQRAPMPPWPAWLSTGSARSRTAARPSRSMAGRSRCWRSTSTASSGYACAHAPSRLVPATADPGTRRLPWPSPEPVADPVLSNMADQ